MKPNIKIYGVLFFVGLLMAYYVSLDRGEAVPEGQRWLNLRAADLNAVRYHEEGQASLSIDRFRPGMYWGVHQQEGRDATEFKVRSFIADVAQTWAELRALRVIGDAQNLDLSDYELDDDKQKISLQFGDQKLDFIIGRRGFQSQEHFVLDTQRNQVIMISRQAIQPFQNATNELYERDILSVDLETVDQITVETGGRQLNFQNRGKSGGTDIRWAIESETSEEEELASAWLNRVLRLQIRSYDKLGEVEDIDQWPIVFQVRLVRNGRLVEEMVLRSASEGSGNSYRLKSTHTHGYVRLFDSRVETLLTDLKSIP